MRLQRLAEWVRASVVRYAEGRTPDFVIGDAHNPYMLRWWLLPDNDYFNIYLHHILRSDDGNANSPD